MNNQSITPYDRLIQTTVELSAGTATEIYINSLIEIDIIVSGVGTHTVLGQEIPCGEGDIFIINADIIHSFSSGDTLCVRRLIFDPAAWLDKKHTARHLPDYLYGVFTESAAVAYARLTPGARAKITGLCTEIEKECESKRHEWESAVSADLSLMLITVGRYITDAIKSIAPAHPVEWELVTATIRAVSERFMQSDLTLSAIASEMFVSESHLSRLFKKFTDQNFSHYLRSVRLEHACRLLRETDMSVEDTVAATGLRDIPYFYRIFHETTGLTPAKYRIENSTNKGELKMQIISEISENLQKGKAKIVKELVQNAVDAGANVEEILNDGLLHGMNIVGEKFKNGEVYVPEVLVAARAMNAGTQILKPLLMSQGVTATGKVCIGTVQGDMHDIGKNLVRMMMEGKGLEVIDLGTDVPAEKFVQTAIDENCQVICCSALLTTTMDVMKEVVDAAEAAGIRDKVKIMVGGAPVNDDFCKKIGADCYTSDAASAANAAVELCK